ncbi:MAG: sulfotransferase [Halieaceae bacterium]
MMATARSPEQMIAEGFAALSAGRPNEALAAIEGMDLDLHPRARLLEGHAHKAVGDHVPAENAYRKLAARSERSHAATGWWSLAGLKTAQFSASDAAQLDELIAGAEQDGYLGLLHLARAEIWHQAGLPDMAFAHLKAGNALIAAARPFQGEAFHHLVNELISVTGWLPQARDMECAAPLFVIGQPRSGTTLVEQILASHPDVDVTDELTFMGHRGADLQRHGGYKAGIETFTESQWAECRDDYLKIISNYCHKGGSHFVDKTPENFMHVALILKIMPNARFIHVIRDPLDNIVSQYRHFFPEGREYSNSIEGLVFYWQGYLMLMRHWSSLFPKHIYHLHYSRLVTAPREEITKLLHFSGLPLANECFAPHELQRPVMTPSAAQVRQPINAAGIDSGLAYGGGLESWLRDIGKLKEASVSLFGNP